MHFLDLIHGSQAARADIYTAELSIDQEAAALNIEYEPAICLVFRVADIMSKLRCTQANFTTTRHQLHLLRSIWYDGKHEGQYIMRTFDPARDGNF